MAPSLQTGIAFDICFDNEAKLKIVFKCTYCLYLQILSSLKFEIYLEINFRLKYFLKLLSLSQIETNCDGKLKLMELSVYGHK